MLRANASAFGHRFLMDIVVPGGVARDIDPAAIAAFRRQAEELAREARRLRTIYDEHAGLQDRFRTCGQVSPELALKLGLAGLAARASGVARDLRCDFPCPPYAGLERSAVEPRGG